MPEDNVPPDSLSLPFPVDLGPMVVLLQATKVVSASEDNVIYPPWITLLCHNNISSKIFRQRIFYAPLPPKKQTKMQNQEILSTFRVFFLNIKISPPRGPGGFPEKNVG